MKTLVKMIASPFELFATDPWDLCGFVVIVAVCATFLGVK